MDRAKLSKSNQLEQEIMYLTDMCNEIDYHCEGIKFYENDDAFIQGIWKDYRIFRQIKKAIVDVLKEEINRLEVEFEKL